MENAEFKSKVSVHKIVWCNFLFNSGNSCDNVSAKFYWPLLFPWTTSIVLRREICWMGNCRSLKKNPCPGLQPGEGKTLQVQIHGLLRWMDNKHYQFSSVCTALPLRHMNSFLTSYTLIAETWIKDVYNLIELIIELTIFLKPQCVRVRESVLNQLAKSTLSF